MYPICKFVHTTNWFQEMTAVIHCHFSFPMFISADMHNDAWWQVLISVSHACSVTMCTCKKMHATASSYVPIWIVKCGVYISRNEELQTDVILVCPWMLTSHALNCEILSHFKHGRRKHVPVFFYKLQRVSGASR